MKRFGVLLIFAVIALLMTSSFSCKPGIKKALALEELKSSIEVLDVETKWVDKYYQPWPPKLTIVPTISFRVKNLSEKPLKFVYFNAIFRLKDEQEISGDAFLAAIRNVPVEPGEKSDTIFLKSNYGVKGKSLASFEDNPFWKTVMVKLFVKFKGSNYIPFGEWEISRKIDFKEPEPVGEKKTEIKKDNLK